ncbi:MAG: lipoate--protein ligase [Gammaproteobacteria bacterium]|nr:lipoate--protein ligase [Gammaproteobacteria bacterium]
MSVRIIVSENTNPWFNLATEDWIFRQLQSNEQILLIWRNEPSVIIGRAQNPWVECNLKAMQKHGVKLARRQSGGGTVFHDLGNLNFTFFSPKADYDKRRNLEIVASALRLFDLKPSISERNDILIDHQNEAYKISGSAFRETKDFAFHHGTLLLDANVDLLRECLRAPDIDIEATGVKSVRSKVINLQKLNPFIQYLPMLQAIVKQFQDHYQTFASIELLDSNDLQSQQSLMASFEQYQTWEWQYAKTLPFVHHLKTENGDTLSLHIKKGLISEVGNSNLDLSDLLNCHYRADSIEQAFPQNSLIRKWLLPQIP